MKIFVAGLMSILFCGGCFGAQQVEFLYFNLSTNEIWVTGVIGLSAGASPGRLVPVHAEDQLSEKSMTFFETMRVADQVKIVWKEGGQQGWPGGLKPGELVPPGISHELVSKRDDLKIPAKLTSGKVRFTYLGNDKWRVKLLDN